MDFILLHQGFDGLDLSYKGNLRPAFIETLDSARERAAVKRQPQCVRIGDTKLLIQEHGAKGGYRYVCDTGPLGAVWCFKRPSSNDPWGIRVSYRSLPLAINGIDGVLENIEQVIRDVSGDFSSDNVSLARLDYAIDYFAPKFALDPDAFVMHSRLTRASDGHISVSGRSGVVRAVRIGKMPGKQLAIYDKRDDVLAKNKKVWWEIWNANLREHEQPRLSPATTKGAIWRIELRAGKAFLDKRCGVRTIKDLRERGQSVFLKIADEIRFVEPRADQNRARWPEHLIWLDVRARIKDGLFAMVDGLAASRARECLRLELRAVLKKQILGCTATLAAVEGLDDVEVEDVASHMARELKSDVESDLSRFALKISEAKDRYLFLDA